MGFVLIRPTAPAKAMVDLMLRLRADPQFRVNTTSTQRTFNRWERSDWCPSKSCFAVQCTFVTGTQ